MNNPFTPNNEASPAHQGKDWRFTYYGESSDLIGENNEVLGLTSLSSAYPLSQAKVGHTVWLVHRLDSIGLSPGCPMEILSIQPSGSVVVAINNKNIAVSGRLSSKMLVSDQTFSTPTMKLVSLKPGQSGIVTSIDVDDLGLSRRLEAMGFTRGQQIQLLRKAWWKGPIHVRVGMTTEVSMRRHEAQGIEIDIQTVS